jgi:D-alanyl-D-alanine carboxypeptidase/poly-gamma-glutamate capsule biosynthesis protein CapA/YwtB (metallophosphatase superfamily)
MRVVVQKVKFVLWTALAVTFGITFASVVLKAAEYTKVPPVSVEDYPTAAIAEIPAPAEERDFYFIKNSDASLKVSAKAYLVGDLDTGEVILKKNEHDKLPIASVSKLITALVAKELPKDEVSAVVTKRALDTYGKNGNLRAGEKISLSHLFYPLLLESSNDSAEVIAEFFGRENFIQKMNYLAEILELENTTFSDPSGLSSGNQSSASDLFKIVGYIQTSKPEIFDISRKGGFVTAGHTWSSNNQFRLEKGYLGGKSGFTVPAKETVVSLFSLPLAEEGTRNVVIALLGSDSRYRDVQSILKYLRSNVYYGGEQDASSDWVKQKEGVPDLSNQDFVNLSFLGDLMFDRGVRQSVTKNFAGDYSPLFVNLESLKKSDFVFANLEGPASDEGKDLGSLYSFRMDPAVIPALRGAGIDVLSVANNHVGDWGKFAYTDTLARLRENEILYTGGGESGNEAEEPAVVERYGMRIGFLGFSDVGPDWMAANGSAGILSAKNPRFEEIIKNASEKVDYLIVSFHWGEEYEKVHNERQEELAYSAIDNGAKLVIGHHPHVMQDVETYKNGLIAYSLGNFIFDQGFSTDTMQGMWLEVRLRKSGAIEYKRNVVKLNRLFQPESVVPGKLEKIEFQKLEPVMAE